MMFDVLNMTDLFRISNLIYQQKKRVKNGVILFEGNALLKS